jgi:superfamily II DNA/RNA helicase
MIISSYFRNTAEFDKKRVYDEFRKPDSKIRIILSTESLGLGVDIPDIYRVVQYSFPLLHDLGHLQQRWGRPARRAGLPGEAIWLVDAWAFGEREPVKMVNPKVSQRGKSLHRAANDRRSYQQMILR